METLLRVAEKAKQLETLDENYIHIPTPSEILQRVIAEGREEDERAERAERAAANRPAPQTTYRNYLDNIPQDDEDEDEEEPYRSEFEPP